MSSNLGLFSTPPFSLIANRFRQMSISAALPLNPPRFGFYLAIANCWNLLPPNRSRSRMNGATQTFRRPSVATNPSHTRDTSQTVSASTPTSSTYMPPHMTSNMLANVLRNGDARYSKEQLLEFYKLQRESGVVGKNVEDYFVGDWDPSLASNPVNGAWGKRDDHKTSAGPEVCWDHGGNAEPLALTDMTEAEKEVGLVYVLTPYGNSRTLIFFISSSSPRLLTLRLSLPPRTPRKRILRLSKEVVKVQSHTLRATRIISIHPPPPQLAQVADAEKQVTRPPTQCLLPQPTPDFSVTKPLPRRLRLLYYAARPTSANRA